ncbi:MAG TPA: hypothetical protein PLU93_11355 [Treponemataceae bacterium]|nr:hypothetical protein [Treponemataceae bacterium]
MSGRKRIQASARAGFLALAASCLLVSCASLARSELGDPFGPIGPGGALYAFVPVDGNRVLLDLVANGFANPDDAKSVLARTETAYLGLFIDRERGPGLRLLAVGRYPRSISRALFPASRGWIRHETDGTPWYADGEGRRAVSFPRSRLAIVAPSADLPGMIGRLSGGDALLPPGFKSRAEGTANASATIGICAPDGALVARFILGEGMSLPVDYLEAYLAPVDSGSRYEIIVRAVCPDAKSARAVFSLARVAGREGRLEGSSVVVGPVEASAEALADFLLARYFSK